jgi:DNA mismatch repair protein MutH
MCSDVGQIRGWDVISVVVVGKLKSISSTVGDVFQTANSAAETFMELEALTNRNVEGKNRAKARSQYQSALS